MQEIARSIDSPYLEGLKQLLLEYDVDEFIFTCDIYDTDKRLENFERLMQIKNS